MDRHGANQTDLARILDISQATVSRWLGGSMPRAAVAAKLAEFLNCRLEWLLEGKGDDPGTFSIFDRPDIREEMRIARLPEGKRLVAYKKLQARAKQKFPYRLRRLREETGLGINEFARRIGCAPSYISRLESAARENPSMKFLDKLTECFGVNRLWLLYGDKPVQYIPPQKWKIVFPAVDMSMLDRLEALDKAEQEVSMNELTRVLDALSKALNQKQMAALIEDLAAKNWGGEFIESVTDILKDLLVKKISREQKT